MINAMYRHHLRQMAQRNELLEKLKQIITENKINSLERLLARLREAGVETNPKTVAREL